MRSELSEVVQVPQVFEVGARVEGGAGRTYVLSGVLCGCWYGWTVHGPSNSWKGVAICNVDEAPELLRVIAPPPGDRSRWTKDADPGLFWDVRGNGTLWNGLSTLCLDDRTPAGVGRWLLQFGYSYAGHAAAPDATRASEATPAREPAPAPWTLTAARRLITEKITAASTRQPAAFTAALCSLAEHGAPAAKLITETAGALTALEAALPERGAVARWQVERAMWAVSDRVKAELSPEKAILAMCACTLYLQRRGAW